MVFISLDFRRSTVLHQGADPDRESACHSLVCSPVAERLQPGNRMIQNRSFVKIRLKVISPSPRLVFPSAGLLSSGICDIFLPGIFAPTCTGTNMCQVMADLVGGLCENHSNMLVFKGCSRRPHSHCLLVQKGF